MAAKNDKNNLVREAETPELLAKYLAHIGQGAAYTWLVNISGLSGFIVWVGVALCHYRFRKAYIIQGNDPNSLPYKAPLFPLGPILAFTLCLVVILGQNYEAVFQGQLLQVLSSYIGLPVFLAVWFIHKWVTGGKLVPYEQMDVSGLEVQDLKTGH